MRDPPRNEEPYGPLRRDVRLLGSLLGRRARRAGGRGVPRRRGARSGRARGARASIGDPSVVRDAVRALSADEQAPYAARVRDLLPAREHRRAAPPAPAAARLRRRGAERRASRSRTRSPACARSRRRSCAGGSPTSRSSSSSPRTRPRRRGGRCCGRTCGSPSSSTRLDEPGLSSAGARRARGGSSPRRSRSSGRPTRCAANGPSVGRRDPARALVLRGEPLRRRRARSCATTGGWRPGAPAAVLVRQLDRRRPRREPGGGRRDDPRRSSGPARRRSRATAPTCASSRSRSPRAARSCDVSPELERVDRRATSGSCTRLPGSARPDDEREPYRASSRSCGGGSATTATPTPRSCSPTSR